MIGTGEMIVIFCVLLVLFGGKKLPEFARSLGLGIREFKNACHGIEDAENTLIDTDKKKLNSTKPSKDEKVDF
jgi:sec-independent protein translocase protein TatA